MAESTGLQQVDIFAKLLECLQRLEIQQSAPAAAVLDEKEAAKYLRLQPQTLALWRTQAKGPAYCRVEGAIRYRRATLDRYLQEKEVAR